jgi:hypothetical protein
MYAIEIIHHSEQQTIVIALSSLQGCRNGRMRGKAQSVYGV